MAKGHENLKPLDERTKDEQRKIAQKGGIESGKARRRKKALRTALKEAVSLPLKALSPDLRDGIDFRDIEITFTANIPANNQEQADIVKALYGLVSQKRLLSLLPFVTDPAEELEELRREQEMSDYGELTGAGAYGKDEGDTNGEVLEKAAGRT